MPLPRAFPVTAILLAAFVAGGCSASGTGGAAGWRNGIVVTADSAASAVAADVLRRGGNAVDAAVTAAFALAVCYPEAGNIGGGGFLIVRTPDGEASTIDFRERAPGRAERDMFLDRREASVEGCLAPAVPGSVAGLLAALELYGTMDRREVLAPAIRLAENGVRVNRHLAGNLAGYAAALSRSPSARKIFFRGDAPVGEGELLIQRDLASTLRRIADSGAAGFYAGRTAALLVEHLRSCGGIIDSADLATYRPVVRPALTGSYRGFGIQTMGPPSSGGLCILQALALLEPHDLRSSGPGSARSLHLTAEALKLAFSTRAAHLGDPDFVDVPSEGILASTIRARAALDTARAVPSEDVEGFPETAGEGGETTHLSVVDGRGMAVALTTTINDLFGNKDVVEGAGFFLNDEMDDFVAAPGASNLYGLVGREANMIAAGKRPLSSMSPTIVTKEGRPILVLGARGGSRIISAVLQTVLRVVEYGMDPVEAVRAPRIHHQWLPDTLQVERDALSPETAASLEQRGHRIKRLRSWVGAVQTVFVDPESGLLFGIPDHREGGAAAGH